MLEEPLILAGDYNVIPEAHDCWDVKVWRNDALYLPETRAAFGGCATSASPTRWRATSDEAPLYSFWDYQAGLLAEEFRHPHRSSDAVAGGGRQARVDLYRKTRPAPGKSRPTMWPVTAEFAFETT